MRYIITRSNGKVVQVWQDNDAAWEFFLAGMSRDVQWKNVGTNERPKIFKVWHEAKWYLDERERRLDPVMKNHDDWEYNILEEVSR